MTLLTSLSLRWRWATIAIALLIVAGGVYSLTRLQIELLPDIDFPLVTVATIYPGAPSEQVLQDVTDPIEKSIADFDGLRSMQSTSSQSISLIIAEFEFGADMEEVQNRLSGRVANLDLPGTILPPRVNRLSPDEIPVLQLSILRPGELQALIPIVQDQIVPALSGVEGVVSAELPITALAGTSITRTNGEPSLPINVLKEPDANTVEVVNAVLERLETISPDLPSDMERVIVSNQAPEIEASIRSLQREAALGGLFAMGMIFFFLLSIRSTLVAAVSIPLSILVGIILMNWQDMSLNVMTLGGLAIAVGRVVDDSIVVLENIYRHVKMGGFDGNRIVAALTATKEVSRAIISSTLTTVAVFLPLAFIGGVIGAFFLPFALTVTFALLASLVVSLTIVPVLGSFLVTSGTSSEVVERRIQSLYRPALRWSLEHRIIAVALAALLFVASLGLLTRIPQTFIPGGSESLLSAEVSLNQPTTLDQMLAPSGYVEQIEDVLNRLSEDGKVDLFRVTAGGSDDAFGGFNTGGGDFISVFLNLTEDTDAQEVADMLRRDFAGEGRTVIVETVQTNGPSANNMELILSGEDYAKVAESATALAAALQDIDGLVNVRGDVAGDTGAGLERIYRFDGRQSVRITGTIIDQNTQRVNLAVDQKVEEVGLPEGVELKTSGVFADIQEAFIRMGIAMLTGIALVYVVMVLTMRSFLNPLAIIFSLPLASIGALAALYVTQRTLGLPALIGTLMLIGLVVTNAIVLISFVEQLRSRGYRVYEALVQGGRVRVRPILMTALTTIFALIPLTFLGEEATIIGAELATVVIGGLLSSTFLTLLVIPVVYSFLRRDRRRPGASAPPADARAPAD